MPTTGTVPLQQVIPGQLIAAVLWNSEFGNIGNLMDPAGIGTYSSTDSQMQLQTNPFPGSVTNHATSLGGELERIRYQLALLTNGATDFWYKPPASDVGTLSKGSFIGMIADAPSATAPNANWHLADGTALSRTIYSALFVYIGTAFGVGDGTTTFNLPDYRDRTSIGAGSTYALGATGGEAIHVLTSQEMPIHIHSAISTVTDPSHSHAMSSVSPTININSSGGATEVLKAANNATVTTSPSITGITVATAIGSTGGGIAHNNLPPYLAMYKIIRIL